MKSDVVRRLLAEQPFRPFTLHMADGRSVTIEHPEMIIAPPDERMVLVCYDDTQHLIDLFLVTDATMSREKDREPGS